MLATLLKPKTPQQLLAQLLDALEIAAAQPNVTFNVTDIDTAGSVVGTLLKTEAVVLADLYAYLPILAGAGYLSLAEGAWLDLIAENTFAETRKPSRFTIGKLRLSVAVGFGNYTIQAGDIRVTDGAGAVFINTTGGTVTELAPLEIFIQAEHPGAFYNVATGVLTQLQTPLPGVSATNLATWLTGLGTQAGADTETDAALRTRCRAKWAALSGGSTRDAYLFWALTASPAVTRVRVRDDLPRGQGTADVILAGAGALAPQDVADVNAYIQARRPVTADILVYAATPVVVPIVATVRVPAALRAQSQAEGTRNLNQIQQELPIDGTLRRAAITEALFAPSFGFGYQSNQLGGIDVQLTTPAADVVLSGGQVATLAPVITYLEV